MFAELVFALCIYQRRAVASAPRVGRQSGALIIPENRQSGLRTVPGSSPSEVIAHPLEFVERAGGRDDENLVKAGLLDPL